MLGGSNFMRAVTAPIIIVIMLVGALSALAATDTAKFLPRDGSKAMTGDLNLGGNDVTNVAAGNLAGPATLTVCAADALNTAKCDYVADGTDDHETIEAAIEALPEDGGKVALSEGTFTGNVEIWKSHVTLEGQGAGTVIKIVDDATASTADADGITSAGNESPLRVLADHVTIQNLTLDGNATNNPGGNERFSDGIAIYANNVKVINNWVRDVVGHGIIVWNEQFNSAGGSVAVGARDNIIITNNHVQLAGTRSGIDVASTGGVGDDINSHVTIANNVIVGTDDATNDNDHGITVHTGEHITITGNVIRDVARGLNLHTNSKWITASGNTIYNARNYGVWIEDLQFSTISANVINEVGDGEGSDFGILVDEEGSRNGTDHLVIADNTINNDAAVATSGIRIIAGHNILVDGNTIRNFLANGVDIRDTGNTVINNTLDTFTDSVNGTGILVIADDTAVVSNRVRNSANSGVRVDFGAENALVTGNSFESITGDGIIHSSAGAGLVIRDNHGYVTEASGTATIASATTSVVVPHGLDVTPAAGDCVVSAAEDPTNDVGALWIDTYDADDFTVHVEADPGASGLDVVWSCAIY